MRRGFSASSTAGILPAGIFFAVILAVIFSVQGTAFGQNRACNFTVSKAGASPTQAHLLEPIEFEYTVSFSQNCSVSGQPTNHPSMICSKIVRRQNDASESVHFSVACQFKSPGFFYTPPIEFRIQENPQGTVWNVLPEMLTIQIHPFIDESSRGMALENRLHLLPWNTSKLPIILVLLSIFLLITAALAVFILWRRRHLQKINAQDSKSLTPIEIYSTEMEKLVDVIPGTIEEYKLYHDSLSRALRQFISQRFELAAQTAQQAVFAVDALSCTTSVLCDRLHRLGIPDPLLQEIQRILGESDRVKFAYETPGMSGNIILLRDANDLAAALDTFAQAKEQAIKASKAVPESAVLTSPQAAESCLSLDSRSDADGGKGGLMTENTPTPPISESSDLPSSSAAEAQNAHAVSDSQAIDIELDEAFYTKETSTFTPAPSAFSAGSTEEDNAMPQIRQTLQPEELHEDAENSQLGENAEQQMPS